MTTEIMPRPPYPIPDLWFERLVDDLKDLITETEFTSRWALIEGYHAVGARIVKEQNERPTMSDFVQCIAKSLNKSERTIYYAVQFAKTYPDLNLLPEGKDCSWFKVVNKYLTTGEKKVTIKKVDLYRMIKEIKELLNTEYLKAHQEEATLTPASYGYNSNKAIIKFIRYLQDQVNKVTEGNDGNTL